MGEVREKEEEEKEARISLPPQKNSGKEKARMGRACLLKGPFVPVYIRSDVAVIGPWTDQGTAWAHPAK